MALTRSLHSLRLHSSAALLAALVCMTPLSVSAQEEGPDAPDAEQPGYSSLNVAQPKGTRELQNALQRLALNPGDIDALIDGGNAALLLGDPQAAIGFFARADEMSPGNGRVKAGLGSGLLLNENPYEALRLFDEAKKLGVPETVFASDRGLAYDLVGNFNAAQADYELALRRGGDDETIRRYAMSLGISGDRSAAEAQLDPLLRKRDAAAWRTRAFVLAVTGDPQGAIDIADATMPKRMAASIEPFFRFMGRLTPAQQAAAAHFGQFPQAAAVGKDDPRNRQYASVGTPRNRTGRADSGLIPAGTPLGPEAETTKKRVAKVDKSQRRRPGKLSKKEREAIALAQAEAAARPVPVQARAPGPVPPSDLLIPGRGTAPATVQAIPGRSSASSSRAMVQPLPTGSTGSATVQPLPSSPNPSPAPTTSNAPVRSVSAETVQGRTASPQRDDREQATVAPARTNPPAVMASVRESVRQPGGAPASAPAATPSPTPAPSASQPAPAPSPTVQEAKPVQLARLEDQPKPGFASLAALAEPTPAPAPAGTTATPAQPAAETPAQAFDLARIGPPAPSPSSITGQSAPIATSPAPSPPTTAQAVATVQPTPSSPATVQNAGTASMVATAPVTTTTPAPERVSLAAVIASITVPPQELAPDEDAVDITKIKPAAPKPPETKKPDEKALEAKKAEAKKAAEKKAAAKPAPPKHPKRYWVQVAGGANRADLSKEWKRLVGEAPAAFKGKQGWWTPLNATNRLLTGPFSGPNEAQAFVNTLAKSKLSGFAFTSPEGQEVTKLGN